MRSKNIHDVPVIIYEGPENSGKTTIKRTVNELVQHKSLSFERWTGTQYAYGMLHKRKVDLDSLLEMDEKMDQNFKVLLVFLFAPPDILLRRKNLDPIEGEKYQLSYEQVEALLYYFNQWFQKTPFRNKIYFDTSVNSSEAAGGDIKKKIMEVI